MEIDILNGLVQVQPHAGKFIVPGQGKARSRSRNAAFRFSVHIFSIQRFIEKSTEIENKNLLLRFLDIVDKLSEN